ncbi:TPA: glutamyl-tRNA reductase [Neisseria meningitidis]|jgi:glutamyl-tRNA reductase|uniref:Glutamyl-tRNA reductase n=7 Tax=Neisseria meningitidis TaxID=487 RepID=HEM1_NEIMB|nr:MULTISPECIES: glutamyl-tRNA reductase [Neisseria]P56994.1 RecName: Full=Glutamyl-tRNA reductase; Short=GluTR [Neisseria meningitidis MC58]AJC62877.1 glutamyl-tRNA reductase [Neisseria meningitidis LNP21362]EOC13820.1 glutamyl-tRNA reductase [Neisseria meningitidis 73696]CCA45282.1 glutamyl-tRNA reductase [Neisseria meningitidis alpha522]AAF41004.1 glutamyl-tRNA reductase [Neisseria meningitidis MC58]ADY96191.1 glutamyl-tRNA reductase [Neisseria meningitidis H44/76]
MQLTAVGLNHQTAPLSIREKLAFAAAALPKAVRNLARSNAATEAVILSTCNRTELYCVGDSEEIIRWLADYHSLPIEEIRPYLYALDMQETVRHAFRVACGLDSMVLGEPQILGQIKDAVRVAQEQESMGKKLNALFQKTFSVAKEVRTDTAVGENSVSMASASVKLAEQIFPDIGDLNVLFIGAGEMIELVATYFAAKSPRLMTVANRTLARAQELCDKLGVNAEPCLLSDLPAILHDYDVVVSSTASQLPIVGKGMVERALKQRQSMPLFMLDLAVPRDIEAEVGDLNDAYLYTVDDMVNIVQSGKEARQKAAAAAETLVSEKVAEFVRQQQGRQSVPLIKALRDEGEKARKQVLENAMKQLAKGATAEEVLERLSVQLTNKLLHSPTQTLNKAGEEDKDLVHAVAQIYHLDK